MKTPIFDFVKGYAEGGGSRLHMPGHKGKAFLGCEKYDITETGLAIAWILRLPEKMQPIVGSTNIDRLKQIAKASDITLAAEDWYKIYLAAGYNLP